MFTSCICIFIVILFPIIFELLDVGIGVAYETAFGSSSLSFKQIELSDLSRGIITEPLAVKSITLAKAGDIKIFKSFQEADATKATLLTLLPLDKMLPLDELATNLMTALETVVTRATLPTKVNQSIQDTLNNLIKSQDQLLKVNATSLFSAEAVNATANLLTALENSGSQECGIPIAVFQDFIEQNNKYFTEIVPQRLQNVSKVVIGIPQRIQELTTKIVDGFKEGLAGSGGIFPALTDLLRQVWPTADGFSMKGIVHVSNMLQNVFLWGISYWVTCVSICAHFLIVGQIFIVLELWARRKGQLPGTGAGSKSSGSLASAGSSSSRSSRTRSGTEPAKDESEVTVEYESKRPSAQQAPVVSDVGDDTPDASTTTFIF
jgi:hypothetical protein